LPSDPHGVGVLVLVVGPSGAGKDSLMDAVRSKFRNRRELVFARRCITRAADAGGEDHEYLTVDQFQKTQRNGGFLLHWQAYGMFYGIPALYRDNLSAGTIVVANVSRMVLNQARRRFPSRLIVYVTASPETLAVRLACRGRETIAGVDMRLRRAISTRPSGSDVLTVINDGALEDAADQFESILRGIAARISSDGRQSQESNGHEAPAH